MLKTVNMKKGFKKQIEHELTAAIHVALSVHNGHAVAKTEKAIKEASKSVAKKFVKSLKALAERSKDAGGSKKKASGVKPAKAVSFKKTEAGKIISVRGANGRFAKAKSKISLSSPSKKKTAHASR